MENNNFEMQNVMETADIIENEEMMETSPAARKKQKILLVAMILCCIAVLATGTLAYFTAEETAFNVITTGVLSMDLVEETTGGEPWPEGGISGAMPGMEVDKIPYVKNDGGIDFWTRMSVSMKVIGENGKELSAKYISLNLNRTDWTEKDGYYYYNSEVKPNEETEPLFTVVSFDEDMPNSYMNATVEINVHADAVQSKNNGSSAVEATGWAEAE